MWTIVFSGRFYKDLKNFLFSTPTENGCFLLANSYKTNDTSVLLVTDIIQPTTDSWRYNTQRSIEPNSAYVNQCVMMAEAAESSLIFVHTHPHPSHPATFSMIDQISNKRMFTNLSSIISDKPLGSLVFSRHGICGVVFDRYKMIHDVHKFKIVGDTLTEFPGIGFEKQHTYKVDAMYDRQIGIFGEQRQERLQNMAATIVGVGGTGSSVAVQLARMGVKSLQLIDRDTVEESNLSRIYGSSNVDVRKPKVEVLKKHIESFSKPKVIAICGDVTDKEILEYLIGSDVIFACTDNLTSRSKLNNIAHRYYIPLIDVGCRIHLNSDNSVSQAIGKVQVVTPDSACLWCSGTLDGRRILQESLSLETKTKLVSEGYYDETEDQPSVISLTTMTASMAVNKLLNLIGVFGDQYDPRTQIEIKNGYLINDRPGIDEDCICQKNSGKCIIEG